MAEFIHTDGSIKTETQIKSENPNTSFPRVLTTQVLNNFGYSSILPSAMPTASSSTKVVVRDGAEKNSDDQWVEKWIEKDRFEDIEGGQTKAEQDAEYQADLDAAQKNTLRMLREPLLKEADWQIHLIEDASGDSSTWRTHRQALRDITTVSYTHLTLPTNREV